MSSSKPFSLSLGGSSTQKKPTLTPSASASNNKNRNLPRRPHHLHDDSDEEDEAPPAHEAVTEFDTVTGTAIPADRSHEKRDLVIPVSSSNNWRDRPGVNARRGKKNLLPAEVQAIREAAKRGEIAGDNVETEGPSMEYGLSFAQTKDGSASISEEVSKTEVTVEKKSDANGSAETTTRAPMTQDEIAMNALIRESKGEVEPRSDLVIESATANGNERYDESTSFKADVATRPDPATLDQYNAIPVEEFGAALLRGMGWKEGQTVGRGKYSSSSPAAEKARVPERRPGFLGIGAKDSGKGGAEAELGAWGKAAMRKGSRKSGQEGDGNVEGVYMPVMMRNKATGDFVTEEELAAKKKEAAKAKRDEDEWKERRDRNLERSGRDRDRDRDRERDSRRRGDRDEDDDRDRDYRRSSRRDRSRSSGDRHSRRRKYDEDDDRYYRDRDRDRERDRDRNRYRDEDRHSSSSSRHGRTRDRERERDRDRERDNSHRSRRRDDR